MKKNPTGTYEWASSNLNISKGCENGCRYCYSRTYALRFKQVDSTEEWLTMRPIPGRVDKSYRKKFGTIMFPSAHDIVPANLKDCIVVLRKVLEVGNNVLIVSKPHLSCIKELCQEFDGYKDNILFRFTIGSLDEEIIKFWEPNAPSVAERILALKWAFEARFQTSVSAEPLLGLDAIALVNHLKPYVTDAIWLGSMNDIKRRVDTTDFRKHEWHMLNIAAEAKSEFWVLKYYIEFKNDPQVKYKDSFKKILGLEIPKEVGLDI